jgi:hypothetical protein
LGISSNDVSTPLRVLWNMSPSGYQNKSFGAIMIGYLGMHSFVPIPVSALFHSVGGLSPLIGLGLYDFYLIFINNICSSCNVNRLTGIICIP